MLMYHLFAIVCMLNIFQSAFTFNKHRNNGRLIFTSEFGNGSIEKWSSEIGRNLASVSAIKYPSNNIIQQTPVLHRRKKRTEAVSRRENISKNGKQKRNKLRKNRPRDASTMSSVRDVFWRRRYNRLRSSRNGLSLWIDEKQVRSFSGYNMEIYVILNGRVMPYILEPDFQDHLPVIPAEVEKVIFTWRSGKGRYFYNFFLLTSSNKDILRNPFLSIKKKGKIPRKPKDFSVNLHCLKNSSGVATFHFGLMVETSDRSILPGTPITLSLKKKCDTMTDPTCDKKCANGGTCDQNKSCLCPEGYMGKFCEAALCYPQCRNGGICTAPGKCTCQFGYHGSYCEGGICSKSCLNGGKCIQKDTCSCKRGYYGKRCEFSKCVIPCVNDGKCRGVNKCRCRPGFQGDHCEIVTKEGLSHLIGRCNNKCRHGTCTNLGKCNCNTGYFGRWCRRQAKQKRRKKGRKKLWI